MKKQVIQVRDNIREKESYRTNAPAFRLINTVKRCVYCDTVGNYNRFAARYNGKTYLVQSDEGDLGDPFRANESYLSSLYIDLSSPCAWNL